MPSIGHVHLKVSDLERSIQFYESVLGLELQQRMGNTAAFLSYDGYHHHVGLNVWESRNGSPPARGTTGLFHLAILFETQTALAKAAHRVLESGLLLDGIADHGVSLALYLHDPDMNGIELYWDRPADEWPRQNGSLQMVSEPFDLEVLLALGRD